MKGASAAGSAPARRITVLLVDDHPIWRGGVCSLLQGTEFEVVGEASSGEEALEAARALGPRLTLLDIRMAGSDGLDTLKALKGEHPQMVILMLTTYENPAYMARARAEGAAGYLLKGIGRSELISALRAAASGELLFPPPDPAPCPCGLHEPAAKSEDGWRLPRLP